MDPAAIQGLHGTLSCAGVIVLNEAIVVTAMLAQVSDCRFHNSTKQATYILVGNNLDTLDVASRLEDLTQDVLRDAGIQASDIQRALVRLRSCATAREVWGIVGG